MKKWILPVTLMISLPAVALVDYSEEESAPVKKSVKKLSKPSSSGPSSRSSGSLSFRSKYDSTKINTNNGKSTGNVDMIDMELDIETQWGLFVEARYWQAASRNLYASKAYEQGNPKAVVGFNWLRSGSDQDLAKVDVYAGYSFKQNDSLLASSRNDQLFGLRTTKRLGDFALGLQGEFRKTGTPSDAKEMDIGDITRVTASLGWVATTDIRFSLEANTYKISTGDKANSYVLEKTLNLATLVPKLHLGITQNVELELGGVFQTRKPDKNQEQNVLDAKLMDIPGAYGNSMFAGLNLSV
jgi:hypothetical protein